MPMLAFLAAAALAAAPAPAAAPLPAPMPQGEELERQIADLDARLFWAGFEGCDPDAMAPLLAPDFRMYHDRIGVSATDAADMVAGFRRQCDARKPGGKDEGYRNRREIVPGSRVIRHMGEWGALEEASHLFFEWRGADKGWALVGGARYMNLWQWLPAERRFVLKQSYSYDHAPAAPYPPAFAAAPAGAAK